MDIKGEIEKIAEEAIKLYEITSIRQYIEDKKKESNLTSQYKGREIYELLQNIDDAGTEDTDCIASIVFDGTHLTVSNNGEPFTIATLQRLCQGGVSDKSSKFIGCKGIGFRSVLNWSDEIEIYSGQEQGCISVKFSTEIAEQRLNELLKSEAAREHIESQRKELKEKGFDSAYPIFRAPEYIAPIEKDFVTVIRLKVKDEIKDNIIKDLKNIERYRNILLFLPKLKEIRFQIFDEQHLKFSKTKLDDDKVRLSIDNNGESLSREYICKHEDRRLERKYEGSDIIKLGVAIPVDEDQFSDGNPYLHTFFPIEDLESPFAALLHATFFLTDNRNDLKLDSEENKTANKEVFENLLDFYIKTVVATTEGDRRLKLLQPSGIPETVHGRFKFNDNLGKLDKEEYFFEKCRDQEIFYTVEGKYKKGCDNDSPIVLDSFPKHDCFTFPRLVKPIDNELTRNFAKRIINTKDSIEEYLYDSINEVSDSWDSNVRISTFKWWESQKYTKLPKLLRTIGMTPVTKESPCFLSEDEPHEWIKEIPKWATISVLNTEDQTKLIQAFREEIITWKRNNHSGDADKRVLPRLINRDLVEILELSSRQGVISPVNLSVGKDFDRGIEFIYWLWKVWSDSPFDETIKTKTSFVVPAEGEKICDANNVYLSDFTTQGTPHSNELGSKIFSNLGKYTRLYENLNFGDAPKERVEAFLKDLGISKYPSLEFILNEGVWNCEEDTSVQQRFVEYVLKSHPLECSEEVKWYNTYLQSINDIENILTNVETRDVIEWIFKDSELKHAIINDIQPKSCYIQYLLPYKKNPWRHNNEWQLPSFIRFVFSKTKWIQIDGTDYSPEELIITNKDYQKYGLNCISEHKIDILADEICSKEELHKLLHILGAKTSYLDLSSQEFYGLLLDLAKSNTEDAKKISRELYRTIIDNSQNLKHFEDSPNKREFMENGKVLVKKTDGSYFEDISKAFFSSYAVIKPDDRYPIDVPTRRGKKEDFREILGVGSYELVYSVRSKTVAACNDAFQKDLESFIPCIMAYRRGKKDEVCNLAIELVKEATITYEDQEKKCTSGYTLLKAANRHWIICVGDEKDYMHLEKSLIADALVQIFNVLFNFPSKDFLNKVEQLFIYSHKQREHFIEDEFGSADEIEISKTEILKSKEFYGNIAAFFGLDQEDTMMGINWNNPSTEDLADIVHLLNECGKSLTDLNDVLERTISIEPYNRDAFMKEYEMDKMKVRSDIHSYVEHSKLISTWNRFEEMIMQSELDFESQNFASSDEYKCIKEEFYQKISIEEAPKVDFMSIYNRNIHELKPMFQGKEVSFNDFLKDIENDSLLYYDNTEELRELIDRFICSEEERIQSERKVDMNTINNLGYLLNNTRIDNKLKDGKDKGGKGGKGRGGVSTAATERAGRQNKKQGNAAEYLTVMKLAAKDIEEVNRFFDYQEYSIHWVSGAAKDIMTSETHENLYDCSETNDGAGYDIRLESKVCSKKMYIEVKSSSTDNCSFFMSANELEKAIEINKNNKSEQYRIIFVSELNVNDHNSSPCITFIDTKIEDGFNCRPLQYNVVYKNQK